MRVLHAHWDKDKLQLWGEAGDQFQSGRASKKAIRPHPFALSYTHLKEILPSENARTDNLTLKLPSTGRYPLPSPQLILSNPPTEPAEKLSEWQIPSLTFEPLSALEFLSSLPTEPISEIGYGTDLRFWVETARLVLEILVSQHFVPSIIKAEKGIFEAHWNPVLDESQEGQVRLLAKVMPPICRAAGNTPLALIRDFLSATVNAFIRNELKAGSLTRPGKYKKTLYDEWLNALTSPDARMMADTVELEKFSSQLESWTAQLKPSGTTFRTCFRLDPPAPGALPDWLLSFYLQANDDPGLLVPAETVWKSRGGTLTFLKRKFENPQERLLADLGRATRLFPPIQKSLKTALPKELKLDTGVAYTFLREAAPLLEQSGYGVFLPPWWQKSKARVGIKLKLKGAGKTSSGILGLNGIVAYDWQAAVGDEVLSPAEFARMAELKVPLVQVRGQWVEVRPEEIEAAIAFFEKQQAGEIELGEALKMGLGDTSTVDGFRVVEVEGEGWVAELLGKLSGKEKIESITQPKTLKGQLRPYQLKGVAWLDFLRKSSLGGCLADDMGLGKSITLISALLREKELSKGAGGFAPTLLVCPMSIVGNWQKEFSRFAPTLNIMVHHGAERLSGEDFTKEVEGKDVVISTYSLLNRDQKTLSTVEWQRIALDEAQNIKNPAAKQSQALKQITAKYRVALTGTPVENRLSELWSIMDFLNPGYLGTISEFKNRFSNAIEKFRDKEKAETLKKLVQPFILRRLKTDKSIIQDLPEKLEMKVYCNLTKEQATLYEAVVKDMLAKIEGADEEIQRKGLVLATLMKLKQVCNHPAQFSQDGSALPGRSGKLARLEEMLEEVLAAGDKALIFTQFAEFGGQIQTYLQEKLGCQILFLHGGTSKARRDEMVQRFQEDKHGAPIFLLSIKAGGVGLNLTAANHVFHFDRWWNPAVENQATDRAFRIGQQKNVLVHKYICVGTIEEKIDLMIEEKKELAENIVGTGESWITEFNTSELKELFALSKEAVGE